MQAAKEVVKDFMHPNRSPTLEESSTPGYTGAGNTTGTGNSGITTRATSSGDPYLDPRGQTTTTRTTQNVSGSNVAGASNAGGSHTSGVSRTAGGGVGSGSQVAGSGSRAATAAATTASGGNAAGRNVTGVQQTTVDDIDVKHFVGDGKADTEVREVVNPAITKEVVIEENKEKKVTAVDRELHQDHYQTRVQPIIDKKVLPEEHVHRAAPVEYRELKHNKQREIESALAEERARFKSTREVLPAKHIAETGGTVVGEHHHHHVYETVQPVIEREIIQPTVTHTTIPVHEHIEKDPSFHPKTVQPVMTMEEFVRAGGTTEGRAERMDIFEGEPQVVENGGADQTHPNAWDARGNHVDAGSSTATRSAASKAAGIASGAGNAGYGGITGAGTSTTGGSTATTRTTIPQTTTTTTRTVEERRREASPIRG